MYEEVEKLFVDLMKRSAQQLLSIKTGSLVPADVTKADISISIVAYPWRLTQMHGFLGTVLV